MRPESRTTTEIEAIASRQHGNVGRRQLLEAGVSTAGIQRRVRSGLLFPRYRGVYRVGHRAPSVLADYMAAVLACGPGALLYGLAAAHLHRLIRLAPRQPEVLAPTERRIDGITTRRCRGIEAVAATQVRGIPVITVPETLVALAAILQGAPLARACHEAGVLHGTTPAMVDLVLARDPSVAGAANLRAVFHGDVKVVLSVLERRFLEVLEEAGLPLPETNRPAGGRRVDCRWPDQRLTVELDGYRFHNSRYSWEQGRRREREARARGDEFRRYSWEDVCEDPAYMLGELRLLLGRRPA